MPKPSHRLVLLSLVLIPATLLVNVTEAGRLVCMVLYLGLLVVALLDILISGKITGPRFYGVKQIRQAKNTRGKFDLFMQFPEEGWIPDSIVLGLPFPYPLDSGQDEQRLTLNRSSRNYRTEWEFTSPQRGLFSIEKVFWRVGSRLGLWLIQGTSDVDLPIRVFPNLKQDRKALANLFMNRGLSGLKLQRISGQGRDYDQIRDYQPGDSLLDIHWKASARRNSLMSKTYQVERTQEIYLIIDHSRLSARKIQTASDEFEDNVLERFVTAANILGMAAVREGDLFGLVTFARHITGFVRAGSGAAHLKAVQNSLFDIKSDNVFPDFDELVSFVRLRLRRRALVVLLTDFSDPAVYEAFFERADLLSRKHLLLVNMVTMAGVQPLFDRDEQGQGDIYEKLAGHLIWKDLHDYRKLLVRKRVTLQLLNSENLALELVNQYLSIKRRQLI